MDLTTSIGTINVNGLAEGGKRQCMDNLFWRHGLDVVLIQEANLKDTRYALTYGDIYAIPVRKHKAGLAVWVSRKVNMEVESQEDIVPAVVQEVVIYNKDTGERTCIFNLHLPHNNLDAVAAVDSMRLRLRETGLRNLRMKSAQQHGNVRIGSGLSERDSTGKVDEEGKEVVGSAEAEFLSGRNDVITLQDERGRGHGGGGEGGDMSVIIAGDLNVVLDSMLDSGNKIQKRPRVVEAVTDIMKELGLEDVYRKLNPTTVVYTHERARIDYILMERRAVLGVKRVDNVYVHRSDHFMVILEQARSEKHRRKSPYWKFKNYLLEDEQYVERMSVFLKHRIDSGPKVDRGLAWWDSTKFEIARFTDNYQKFWKASNNYRRNKADNGCVDGCFYSRGFGNTPPMIVYLKDEAGSIIHGKDGIKGIMEGFYSKLYKLKGNDDLMGKLDSIHFDQVREEGVLLCEEEYTGVELYEAAMAMNRNKSPGLDGLTLEFYLCFWDILAGTLFNVFKAMREGKVLEGTMAKGVITLIQKKGDPKKIENWRPITLMTVDLKIFCKTIANRLKRVIADVVSEWQTAIPSRTIHWNLTIIRDVMTWAVKHNRELVVLSIDQKKAFDRVNHEFLFQTMRKMGFGPGIIDDIATVYNGYHVMIKNGSDLTNQIPFGRGVRQGDSLSSLLYAIALEPVLRKATMELDRWAFRLSDNDVSSGILWSAYADDITFFLNHERAIGHVLQTFEEISRLSEADINITKSSALGINVVSNSIQTVGRHESALGPGGGERITWLERSIRILGVEFGKGTQQLSERQFGEITKGVDVAIQRNFQHLVSMSYKERALWANTRIWPRWLYVLKCVQPSKEQTRQIQAQLVEVIWLEGRHWLPKETLMRSVDDGGVSIVNVEVKLMSIRIATLGRIMYMEEDNIQYKLAEAFCNDYADLNYGFKLVHVVMESRHANDLPEVYKKSLEYWKEANIAYSTTDVEDILELPAATCKFLLQAEDQVSICAAQVKEKGTPCIRDVLKITQQRTREWNKIKKKVGQAVEAWKVWSEVTGDSAEGEGKDRGNGGKEDMTERSRVVEEMGSQNQIGGGEAEINMQVPRRGSGGEIVKKMHLVVDVGTTRAIGEMNVNDIYKAIRWKTLLAVDRCCQDVEKREWRRAFNDLSPSAHNNLQWRFLHRRETSQDIVGKIRGCKLTGCLMCGDEDVSREHTYMSCEIVLPLRESVWGRMKEIDLVPSEEEERVLYDETENRYRLANVMIKAYRYTITLLIRNTERIVRPSATKLVDTFYKVIERHIDICRNRKALGVVENPLYWEMWTYKKVLVKLDSGRLYVRIRDNIYKEVSGGQEDYKDDSNCIR